MKEKKKVEIIVTNNFEREAKRLIKKYPSLRREFEDIKIKILENPKLGTQILHNVFKIRLGVKSKGKGKRAGLRIITYLFLITLPEERKKVFLVSVYDKSSKSNIPKSLLKFLIDQIKNSEK